MGLRSERHAADSASLEERGVGIAGFAIAVSSWAWSRRADSGGCEAGPVVGLAASAVCLGGFYYDHRVERVVLT
jgi:hypothetical protein